MNFKYKKFSVQLQMFFEPMFSLENGEVWACTPEYMLSHL